MESIKRIKKHKAFSIMLMLQIFLIMLYFFLTAASIQNIFIMNIEVPKVLGNNIDKIIHLELQNEDKSPEDMQQFRKELKEQQLIKEMAYYDVSGITSDALSTEEISILKIAPELNQIKKFHIREGRFFSTDDLQDETMPLLAGSKLAQKYDIKIGDVINNTTTSETYQIIGILEEGSNWIGQTIPENYILLLDHQFISIALDDYVRLHYYCISESSNMADVIERIESIAKKHNFILEANTVRNELNKHFETMLDSNIYWLIFAIVLMIIISIGMASLTITHLYTRKKELGIRLAVGYTPNRITALYSGELLIFTLLAYGVACLTGYIMIGNG
ncbi:MAG: ABC transporter permease, partial [Lachnoclostridium sp.]|nr:ABC transporter permease [Lachnoclostridium sp.]